MIASGELGTLWRLNSVFDLDDPDTLEVGPAHGLLRDLGSHSADQAQHLLGPVRHVNAQLDWVEVDGSQIDCGFVLTLEHCSGARSYLSASKLDHVEQRAWRLYGSSGSYVAAGTDVQAQAIFAGRRPLDDLAGRGFEQEADWGRLHLADGTRRVPSAQGDYAELYRRFAAAVAGERPLPVTSAEAIAVIRVLDAAGTSDAQRRTRRLDEPQGLCAQ